MESSLIDSGKALLQESTEKLNKSASRIASGSYTSPVREVVTQIEASRQADLAVEILHTAQEIDQVNLDLVERTEDKKGRAFDSFS